jgi:hypothetical protein
MAPTLTYVEDWPATCLRLEVVADSRLYGAWRLAVGLVMLLVRSTF